MGVEMFSWPTLQERITGRRDPSRYDATDQIFFLKHYFFFLLIQYFKRVTHLAVIAILPCGPLCKHIFIYTNTKVI